MSQASIQQNKKPLQAPNNSTNNFYTRVYDTLVCDESMRTDVDRKLALVVREVCQSSHYSRAERDAVAVFTDLSHLGSQLGSGSLSVRLFWKWAFVICDRAAKELSRLEADLRVEAQKRHELLMAKKAEKDAEDAKGLAFVFKGAVERVEILRARKTSIDANNAKDQGDIAIRRKKRLQTADPRLARQQRASCSGLESQGTKDQLEELTRMMARWHL
jgi:hypothetical protein